MPLAILVFAACGRPVPKPVPDTHTDADTDSPGETDVPDTDHADTDVAHTDDPGDTDRPDTDPADTDDSDDTDAPDTDAPLDLFHPRIDTGEVLGPATFAVIGDYGVGTSSEASVSVMVHGWAPDFIVTTGDNNYPAGSSKTIDDTIGRYYYDYIYPYAGSYGTGATDNAFYPSLGNHDWETSDAAPYLAWFELPGTEYYYDFVKGDVHFFVLDSDPREPDGVDAASAQAAWLEATLATSTAAWQVVVFHHPAFSSGDHGSTTEMQWPFGTWGVDLVLTGHDHIYERLETGGVTYIVNGIGGAGLYGIQATGPLPESLVQFDSEHGAMFARVDATSFEVYEVTTTGVVVDHFWVGEPDPTLETLLPTESEWKYLDDGTDPGPTWRDPTFDDSAWDAGDAPLGFNTSDLNTILAGATDLAARPTTTLFRTTFDVVDPAAYTEIRLGLVRDDGAIVYINGTEVLRSNVPTAGVMPATTALRSVNNGSENIQEPAWIDASVLTTGTNTVAVEVHQFGPADDLKLDLQIDAK